MNHDACMGWKVMHVLHAVFYTVYHHYQTQSLSFVAMHNVVWSFSWARGNLKNFWHITLTIRPCISKSGCISLKSHISESNAMQSPEIWYSPTLCNSNKSLISYPDASHPLILYAAVLLCPEIILHVTSCDGNLFEAIRQCCAIKHRMIVLFISCRFGWFSVFPVEIKP